MHANPVHCRNNAALHVALTTNNSLRTHANGHTNPDALLWEVPTWNRAFPHPTAKPEWTAEILAEVDRRYAADSGWFRRAYADGTAFKTEPVIAALASTPSAEAEPHPLATANLDLDSRATLILKNDAWLSRLAEHNEEMRNRIIVALGDGVRRAGSVSAEFCARMYISVLRSMDSAGMRHTLMLVSNESLITRARNYFANVAAFDTDSSGRPYTHLLFIDADLAFRDADVLAMVRADKPIVALPYSRKGIDWQQVAEAGRRGIPAEQLAQFAGRPAFNPEQEGVRLNEISAVRHAPTGCMLIRIDVFKALAEAHPERKYSARLANSYTQAKDRECSYDFFSGQDLTPETKAYLSEDFQFCEDARAAGYQRLLVPWAEAIHTGTYDFRMSLQSAAALQSGTVSIASLGNVPVAMSKGVHP
jgi:hypothetical protein